ncbi:phytoene desaturase family protein [Streptomyces sp. NRRL F-5123]|uniref:phytoene desaturase family protein n=1 Tax=Streptomyces sp. NRRL F-5123 TaxID=1463856 RepID=UPI000B0697E7|nr:NAD(P)/FAD-dependent oxidoreductase [Streptomyces sp. NRRL F-5123]
MPERPPKVIVVGAGVSGLAAGCYAQMSGMESRIFEKHVLPGGCCTSWARQGYLFDYCIDWLIGTAPGNDAHQVWRELGALDGKSITDFEIFNRVVDEHGREVRFYNDPDRLQAHLLELSPADARHIRRFCADLRRFTAIDLYPFLTPPPLRSVREKLELARKVLPAFRLFWRTGATQMDAFCARLQDPLLRRAFPFVFFQDHEVFPLLPYLFNMAAAHRGNCGFPQGGSLGLARSVEKRYRGLGGRVDYRSAVTRVLVEGDRAVGVELKNGTREFADHVIAACDGPTVLRKLLDGRWSSPVTRALFDEALHRPETLYPGVVSAFVGLTGDLPPDTPHSTTYLLSPEDSARLPAVRQNSLVVQVRSQYADGFAPPGRSVVHCTYFSDFGYWQELRAASRKRYRARKREVADFLRDFLERKHPGTAERTEVVDVATPVTLRRFTGNHEGSILAWKSFTDTEKLTDRLVGRDRMRLPGLAGFSMTGQWVAGGGLIRAASAGRFAVHYLCDELKVPFQAWPSDDTTPWHPSQWGELPQLGADATYSGTARA